MFLLQCSGGQLLFIDVLFVTAGLLGDDSGSLERFSTEMNRKGIPSAADL